MSNRQDKKREFGCAFSQTLATSSSTSSSSSSTSSFSHRGAGDELSIDSRTNEKVPIHQERVMTDPSFQLDKSNQNYETQNQKPSEQLIGQKKYSMSQRRHQHQVKMGHQNETRPHFRIDWRQLTYYQKPDSLFSRCLGKVTGAFGNGQDGNKHRRSSSEFIDSTSSTGNQIETKPAGPRRILNSLDGCFKSGQLSAILGPSGAGKSTFLDTLFGSKQESAFGQTKVTWFNEDGLPAQMSKRRNIRIAVLPQHDHLLHHLTVYETLMFASKIKNASRHEAKRESFHKQNVRKVAKMLKLTECLDTRCGKLSGGQYKRVSIGQELLSEPDVIILDEPTSGLDAMTCLTTVKTLKSIVTKHPMSIILTIHQPDIDVFNLFDHIYVIAQGGMAIYEGAPGEVASTLASVDLHMPSPNYNPARFIVEHAFVVEYETANGLPATEWPSSVETNSSFESEESSVWHSEDDSDDEEDAFEDCVTDSKSKDPTKSLRRSLVSLTEVISGKEMSSGDLIRRKSSNGKKGNKRPLLNIGIQTSDGRLITSKQLKLDEELHAKQVERLNLLKRLNQIQKAKYQANERRLDLSSPSGDSHSSEISRRSPIEPGGAGQVSISTHNPQVAPIGTEGDLAKERNEYSSASCLTEDKDEDQQEKNGKVNRKVLQASKSASLALVMQPPDTMNQSASPLEKLFETRDKKLQLRQSMPAIDQSHYQNSSSSSSSTGSDDGSEETEFVVNIEDHLMGTASPQSHGGTTTRSSFYSTKGTKMIRKFDKKLSAKHNCSKTKDYPIWYHTFLLTHRTWLSIIRDPVFFGIQACMHTIIPILLALIFGSSQEEGCPRVGGFDLVDFAYSGSDNMIQGTVSSIRKSIANIGIVFFEMFVITFAINCITALVFPLDMFVLLKEYRNGWYSMRSYFFGRTLADLPVPIVLHTIAISILYFMTDQPHSWWRFGGVVLLIIIASLVAQSIGLTIGAILMRSSQSAVLAAAGFVAPFFALSGFIVRIHTLPILAKIGAQGSYLYHLLNGFIILRHGFGRCQCKVEDFEQNSEHQIPSNLHTLASMWIGTYSNEYASSQQVLDAAASGSANDTLAVNSTLTHNSQQPTIANLNNRSNIDPNIDVVDKMMTAFKMASSYGQQIENCNDVLPYAMLDFNVRDSDIYGCFLALVVMLIITRLITFSAIYYKIRSFT